MLLYSDLIFSCIEEIQKEERNIYGIFQGLKTNESSNFSPLIIDVEANINWTLFRDPQNRKAAISEYVIPKI